MKYFFLILILALCMTPSIGLGAPIQLNLTYPTFEGLNLAQDQGLPQIIKWFYYAIVGISGFAAFVMIVWDGVKLIGSSASNPGATKDARTGIQNTVIGLLIVLASFLILQLINPDFTILRGP